MGHTENYIEIMEESLKKKIQILEKIVLCTDIESEILAKQDFQMDQFEKALENKSPLIEELNHLDDGFTALFEKVKPMIEGNQSAYKNQIASMKESITSITELSVKIQRQELRNKGLAEKNFALLKSDIKKAKHSGATVANYYKSASVMSHESQFIDKKE